MGYDESLIRDVVDDLVGSRSDPLVMAIIRSRETPTSMLRIHRSALIYNQSYAPDGYREADRIRMYTDDVEESCLMLSNIRILSPGREGMLLSGFGEAVAGHMESDDGSSPVFERARRMESSLGRIDDMYLLAITCHMYPGVALIPSESPMVAPIIRGLSLNGTPLPEWTREDFTEHVLNGDVLSPGGRTDG